MPEYIAKSEAIEVIQNDHCDYPTWPHIVEAKEQMAKELKAIPAADVAQVVHGQWRQSSQFDEDENVYVCSNCGEPWMLEAGGPEDNNMNFCPNCGAKMDLEDKP